jgi:hypothetical protein
MGWDPMCLVVVHLLCTMSILSISLFINFVFNFCVHFDVQLPWLYNVYKKMGIITSFQNILDNVFIRLFEATVYPSSHPQLHLFLVQVS